MLTDATLQVPADGSPAMRPSIFPGAKGTLALIAAVAAVLVVTLTLAPPARGGVRTSAAVASPPDLKTPSHHSNVESTPMKPGQR